MAKIDKRKRLVLCLDGTWQNPYQMRERDDGSQVLKPSNPLKLARAVLPCEKDADRVQITYYDTGVGSLGKYPGVSNRIVDFVDNKLGGGWGAGFEANIEQAVTFLVNNYVKGDKVFVFGFSRGAAQARGLTRFIDWMGGIPTKSDAYFVPLYFREYLSTQGKSDPANMTTSSGESPLNAIVPMEIEMLGVWETVMALGSRFLAKNGTAVARRSFHVGEKPAVCVKNARQALAIDEKRYDFRPDIWLGHRQNQTLKQRWFVGVHSNIGGGYVRDGLANIPFHWLLEEARVLGLVTDPKFVGFYKPYPQAQIHESWSIIYKTIELIRLKRKSGFRVLNGYPDSANLTVDKSVFHRLRADPEDHDQLDEPYRPQNLIDLLKDHSTDLPGYLASLGLKPESPLLPKDVAELVTS